MSTQTVTPAATVADLHTKLDEIAKAVTEMKLLSQKLDMIVNRIADLDTKLTDVQNSVARLEASVGKPT